MKISPFSLTVFACFFMNSAPFFVIFVRSLGAYHLLVNDLKFKFKKIQCSQSWRL